MLGDGTALSPASVKFPSDTQVVTNSSHPFDNSPLSNNRSRSDASSDGDGNDSKEETRNTDENYREYSVQVVTGLKHAMDPQARRQKTFAGLKGTTSRPIIVQKEVKHSKASNSKGKHKERNFLPVSDATMLGPGTQFRLSRRVKTLGSSFKIQTKSYDVSNLPAVALGFTEYVHWTYKATFWEVIGSLTAFYLAFVTLFAILAYVVGRIEPNCLYVGSLNFAESGYYFIDAFQVSWTTFSTVVRILNA